MSALIDSVLKKYIDLEAEEDNDDDYKVSTKVDEKDGDDDEVNESDDDSYEPDFVEKNEDNELKLKKFRTKLQQKFKEDQLIQDRKDIKEIIRGGKKRKYNQFKAQSESADEENIEYRKKLMKLSSLASTQQDSKHNKHFEEFSLKALENLKNKIQYDSDHDNVVSFSQTEDKQNNEEEEDETEDKINNPVLNLLKSCERNILNKMVEHSSSNKKKFIERNNECNELMKKVIDLKKTFNNSNPKNQIKKNTNSLLHALKTDEHFIQQKNNSQDDFILHKNKNKATLNCFMNRKQTINIKQEQLAKIKNFLK